MPSFQVPLAARLFYSLYHVHYPSYRKFYFLIKRFSDRKIIRLLRERISPGMTVLDIGANIGYYSRILSNLVGKNGRVYSFEPGTTNFLHLQDTVKNCANVQAIQMAVGASVGRMSFTVSRQANIENHLGVTGDGDIEQVDVVSIDSFCRDLSRVDVIKMDIQGGEYHALQGMCETCSRNHDLWVFFEFWPFGLARAGVEPKAILCLLEDMGFIPRLLDGAPVESFRIQQDNWTSYTDIVCERT
jgi:FkbM family methyltransferase